MRPHTTLYVSSYYYICPHTTIYVSSYYYICVLILYMCRHAPRYLSSYYYTCVLMHVSAMCPHTTISVLMLPDTQAAGDLAASAGHKKKESRPLHARPLHTTELQHEDTYI
jgi:hypothetical protein